MYVCAYLIWVTLRCSLLFFKKKMRYFFSMTFDWWKRGIMRNLRAIFDYRLICRKNIKHVYEWKLLFQLMEESWGFYCELNSQLATGCQMKIHNEAQLPLIKSYYYTNNVCYKDNCCWIHTCGLSILNDEIIRRENCCLC